MRAPSLAPAAPSLMLDADQVAEKIQALIEDGTIASVAVGRSRRVRRSDLEEFVAGLVSPDAQQSDQEWVLFDAPSGEKPSLMLKVEQVADLLQLGETKTWELIGDGTIPSVPVGRNRRVRMADLQAFVDGLEPSLPEPEERHLAAAVGRRQQSQMAYAGRSP